MKYIIPLLLIATIASAQIPSPEDVQLVELMNVERSKVDLPPLLWNPDLWQAAYVKAKEQHDHNGSCPAHDSCDNTPWWKRVQSYYPNWSWLGENTATTYFIPTETIKGWMGSPAHRANILSPFASEAGCAYSEPIIGFNTWYEGVCDLGSQGQLPQPSITPKPTKTPKATKTPRPTRTPKPSKTPKPTRTPTPTRTSGHR